MTSLLSIEEALARVLARARPREAEPVAVEEAAGQVLAAGVAAGVDLPPFASSAMDGYAIRAEDTPGRLPVVAQIAAGVLPPARSDESDGDLDRRRRARRADSVVPIEQVVVADNAVEIQAPVELGANVRPAGGDVRAGDALLAAGTRLGAAQVGALAAVGLSSVSCARRPRVAVLSTGTELRRPGEQLRARSDLKSNAPMLAAAFATAGAQVESIGPVADDEGPPAGARRGLEADLLVSSGGVSMRPARPRAPGARRARRREGRTSGASRSGRASRRPSAPAGGRLSSGCPGTRLGARRVRAFRPACAARAPGCGSARPGLRAWPPRVALAPQCRA